MAIKMKPLLEKMSDEEKKQRARELRQKKRDDQNAAEAKRRKDRRAYIDGIKEKLGKSFVNKMYKNISQGELKKALDKAKWKYAKDVKHGAEFNWIMSNYSRQSSIAGGMDYNDHRKDSIDDIKRETYDDIKTRTMQNLQYYNINGKIFDIVSIELRNGSWSVEPAWSDGAPGYSSIA
jgi:hypothetical protein